jgi:multisubunit Na+/H+ antiporter MnhB subunit
MLLLNHFLLKLVLAPLIIASATLVARRWGQNIGGLMVGLPLTSGPVSVFFAVEQGRQFAANAAIGSLLGLIPVAVFCAGYVQNARRFPWYLTAAISIGLYLVTVWFISFTAPDLALTSILVPSILCLALLISGRLDPGKAFISSPWWDLPLRMIVASGLILAITTAASSLGSKWSGLLSPFPIFTFVMATFSHYQGGSSAASRLIRGVLVGLFSYTAFFLVVALLVDKTSLFLVYALAAFTALGVDGVSLLIYLRNSR